MSLARARVLDVDTPDPAAQALIAFDDELSRLGEPSLEWLKRHDSFAAQWQTCRNASVMLALAWRFAPRPAFLTAALKCAERALPARSTPEPALARALALAREVVAGRGDAKAARDAAALAYGAVSRHVAGVDDDVGMAVTEACDLVAGDAFEPYGPDPAFRTAWALATAACTGLAANVRPEVFEPEEQALLADVVRAEVPAEALVFRTR